MMITYFGDVTAMDEDIKGRLTLKFNRATQSFLKIDMRHGANRHEKEYYRHDMDHFSNSTGDIKLF